MNTINTDDRFWTLIWNMPLFPRDNTNTVMVMWLNKAPIKTGFGTAFKWKPLRKRIVSVLRNIRALSRNLSGFVFSNCRDDGRRGHAEAPSADSLGLDQTAEPPHISFFSSCILSDGSPELLLALPVSGFVLFQTDSGAQLQDPASAQCDMGDGLEVLM